MMDLERHQDEREALEGDLRHRERPRGRVQERDLTPQPAIADRAPPADIEALRHAAARRRQLGHDDVPFEHGVRTSRALVMASRLLSAVFFVIYALLGLRLVLGLVSANPDAPFVRWSTTASDPLAAPFRGIFPNVTFEDGFTFALSVAFAMLVYALVHALLYGVVRVFAAPRGL
ncbi:MAG TPA: hypothetical protein VF178_06545 [Gemmatimonadaceae bacterium]